MPSPALARTPARAATPARALTGARAMLHSRALAMQRHTPLAHAHAPSSGDPAAEERTAHILAVPLALPTPSAGSMAAAVHASPAHRARAWLFAAAPMPPAPVPAPSHAIAQGQKAPLAERARTFLLHTAPARVAAEWRELNAPGAAGWKKWAHAKGEAMLARRAWEEQMLAAGGAVAPPVARVVVYYVPPAGDVTPDEVQAAGERAVGALAAWARERAAYHAKWRTYAALGLPATAAMGVLPGPNVPLAYNGYRAYAHHTAHAAAAALAHALLPAASPTAVASDPLAAAAAHLPSLAACAESNDSSATRTLAAALAGAFPAHVGGEEAVADALLRAARQAVARHRAKHPSLAVAAAGVGTVGAPPKACERE